MSFNYTVEKPSGATYGFSPKADNYYESNNKGINSSYAMAKLNFTTDGSYKLYLDCINYAETNYDFGILGNLDKNLTTTSDEDSAYAKSFKGLSQSETQTYTYISVEPGNRFIEVKYRKDYSSSSGNDSFQFKIEIQEVV